MEAKKRNWGNMVLSLISAFGLAVVIIALTAEKVAPFDDEIIGWVKGIRSESLTPVMKFFSFVGAAGMVVLICLVLLFVLYRLYRRKAELVFFATVVAGDRLLNEVLKRSFQRLRPENALVVETGFSFPSGHSMVAFALYGALVYLFWRHTKTRTGRTLLVVAAALMIFLIGFSRIYLGVHYPSDVVGGFLTSGLWLGGCIWCLEYWAERQRLHG